MSITPAPWHLGTHPANHKLNIIKPVLFGSRVTVLPECEGGHVSIKNIDDARLIAASPELLAALQYAVEKYGKEGGPWNVPSDPGGWLERSRAAIEKATGGQKP